MKKYFKILFAVLVIPMLIVACRDEADRNWTTPDGAFKLNSSTLASETLYETMKGNPFTLTWDNILGSNAEYTVMVSATEDFAKPVVLGKSNTSAFTTTIGTLNDALLSAGFSPYKSQKVYVRVVSGTNNSNTISFNVTPYPSAKPVITSPTVGSSIVLDAAKSDEVATVIKWNDYSYGTDVVYLVEIAKKGSLDFNTLGTVNNLRQLSVTNLALNKAVLRLGGVAGTSAEYDVKVTATTSSVGGTIKAVSDVVTFKVIPFQLESYIYALGVFNNWSHDTAEIFTSPTSDGIYFGYINFPAAGTEFKITEAKNWDVNYGDNGADGTLEKDGTNIKSPGAGYHKITVDLNAKTITMVPEVWGVIGDATPNGWDTPDTSMTWNGVSKTWETVMNLKVGEIKFRKNNAWDVNYGDDGTDGTLNSGGKNIPVTVAGNYRVVFDELNLTYKLIKQ